MMIIRIVCTALLVFVAFSSLVGADTDVSARNPIAQADLIVVGDVTTRHETPTDVSFTIAVTRVLKGDPGIQAVDVEHPWASSNVLARESADINVRISGIWFLHHLNTGGWDVYPVAGRDGSFVSLLWPASQMILAVYSYDSLSPISDIIVSEMLSGVEQHGLPPNSSLLTIIPSTAPALQTALQRFLQSSDVKLRVFALSRLLRSQSPTAIAQLRAQWPSMTQDENRLSVLNALRDNFRSNEPRAVSQLVTFTNTLGNSDELRGAAVIALQRIHTKETLAFFGRLLDSTDENEQMAAVIALSAFANGCPMQTSANASSMAYLQFGLSPYRTNETEAAFAFRRGPREEEDKLISFWKTWWASNQAKLSY